MATDDLVLKALADLARAALVDAANPFNAVTTINLGAFATGGQVLTAAELRALLAAVQQAQEDDEERAKWLAVAGTVLKLAAKVALV